MAWKETDRAAATMFRLTFQCTDCGFAWEIRSPERDAEGGDCALCVTRGDVPAAPPTYVVPRVAMLTNKSRAIDYTQSMVEADYGLTDFNDNQRAGDIGYKAPAPMHTAQREKETHELVQAGVPQETAAQIMQPTSNFWQGAMAGSAESTLGNSSVAAQASKAAKDMGVDPIGMLESGRERGIVRPEKLYNVVASDKM